MKKFINNLISILFIVLLCSCTFNVGDKKDGDDNESPPPAPENIYPGNGAVEIPLAPQLNWTCYGSNTNNLRFDVFLCTNNPPNIKIDSGLQSFSCNIDTPLEGNRTYYWKVIAKNDHGESSGNVWTFTTTAGGLPTDGLVAYYPFNGNTMDESGNGNNGQNYGAYLTWDRFNNSNKAYGFNNAASYISVPHNSSLQPADGLTLSTWVFFNDLSNTGSVLSKGSDTTTGWYSLRYESSTRTLDFQINFSDYIPGPRMTVSSSSTLVTNTWYYVVGTFDGNQMKLYLSGQSENTLYAPKTLGSNYEYLTIGNCGEGYPFNGTIDDIRIYKRALNDNEIQQLFHEGGWLKKSISSAKR